MTADVLLLLILTSGATLATGLGFAILSAFGKAGWFVILALFVAVALVLRFFWARLAVRLNRFGEDLHDEWRAG